MTFSAEYLDVPIRPSLIHCTMLVVVHVLAIVAIGLSDLELWFALAMAFVVLTSLTYVLWRFGLQRDSRSVARLVFDGGEWQLVLMSGAVVTVRAESRAVVLSWLVAVNFRDSAGVHYPVTILPDTTGKDEFRRLKVLLKYP